ncbi:MAG: prepilin-type N-terminal cleavage/methylation domain-containing protein [Archangium sp.]|nr:prepilin-type N-terminal cleavage/methylation domain-containing protein [Archangium sp.]
MSRRGMTLIELMVSASIGLVVIAGVVSASMAMQATSGRLQQVMGAQQSLRSAADLISLELEKAGSGIGNARLGLGGSTTRNTITVASADAFTSDSTFELPLGAYAAFPSDSLLIFSGRTSAMVQLECCPGIGTCGGSCSLRNGGSTCTAVTAPPEFITGSNVVYVNPTLGVACAHRLTSLPATNLLVSSAGLGALGAFGLGDVCADTSSFWCTSGGYAMELDAVSLRINWKPTTPGGPQRPRLQLDADGPYGSAPYVDVLWDVERLQVRVMIDDLTNPGTFSWFPDATAGRPALDLCTPTTPGCGVPGGTDARDLALSVGLSTVGALQAQLNRRIRGIEVTLTSRSTTFDAAKIRRVGTLFALDANGLPLDGYDRRRVVFQATPRNFALLEGFQ